MAGKHHRAANGREIRNLGERRVKFVNADGQPGRLRFQVAETARIGKQNVSQWERHHIHQGRRRDQKPGDRDDREYEAGRGIVRDRGQGGQEG